MAHWDIENYYDLSLKCTCNNIQKIREGERDKIEREIVMSNIKNFIHSIGKSHAITNLLGLIIFQGPPEFSTGSLVGQWIPLAERGSRARWSEQ